jgi:molybdopterin/thiamine biosynthesis adenylyltransferase
MAESFYAARDSRTTCCAGLEDYRNARVVLSIDETEAHTLSGQVSFLIAANLLSRWCRQIRFLVPSMNLLPRAATLLTPGGGDLAQGAMMIAQGTDPFGDFGVGMPPWSVDHYLHVGRQASLQAYPILGRGWLALGGGAVRQAVARDGTVVLGAVLAACVGNAQVFRAALRHHRRNIESVRLSLWNLRGAEAAVDGPDVAGGELGQVHLIGCGAVGSTIAYLVPLAGLMGSFGLADGDLVDESNLNRSPLFVALDVGQPKVKITASYLRRHGLVAHAHEEWFDAAVRAGHLFQRRPDMVIPTANDYDVRYSIQNQAPPLQVYGTTGQNWDAFLGRHIPFREDCLACRFPKVRMEGEAPLACSTVRLPAPARTDGRSADAALPFLSTAAASLAVAELVKATLEGYPVNPNFACLDFRGNLTDFVLDQRLPSPACTCASQRRIWPVLNGLSHFAPLSMGRTAEALSR